MESTSFLRRPQIYISIISWNINTVRTKLEKDNVSGILKEYDIINLNEIKTPLQVSYPGYVSIPSRDNKNPNRGGTCVLIKNYLSSQVTQVDISRPDQVWLQLKCQPGVLFGFLYIPPHDSPYFSESSFSYIQEKIKESSVSFYVIIGDLNARFGNKVRELNTHLDMPDLSYPTIPDPILIPNSNANLMYSICSEEKLLVVNNAKINNRKFKGDLTYKQGNVWVSEVDVCIISPDLYNSVENFRVRKDIVLPSDHAPISFDMKMNKNLNSIYDRAAALGDHDACYSSQKPTMAKKTIRYKQMDSTSFLDKLAQQRPPDLDENIERTVENMSNILYESAKTSQITSTRNQPEESSLSKWEKLLECGDDRKIWAAINWKGEFNPNLPLETLTPSDDQFKEFFTRDAGESPLTDMHSEVYISVLDDPITDIEVCKQIQDMESDRAGGTDGVPPGVLKLLPANWLIFLTCILNNLFSNAVYPQSWTLAKMVTIFKKGNRRLPGNYRGITIINCLAKLYDKILCYRLHQWFRPYREQAGSQQGRGCVEHIVTLRLVTDYAIKKKIKLYIIFVDFSQAYDNVPRATLFSILKRLGCGAVMLLALISMYKTTQSLIGTVIATTCVGVRQGSPTSCVLFVVFVNELIKLFKERCGPDGFLAWLHLLVFMDDTVILSTSRNGALKKLGLLKEFCDNHGMFVNVSKTKFMVINGKEEDRSDLVVDNMHVKICSHYIYLGTPFCNSGKTSSSIKINADIRMCQALKFVSFCQKNNDAPFYVKKKIFNAALMSSILYGCESWLDGNIKPMENLYNMCIKHLLGVRKTTNTNLCLIELGLPSLKSIIRQRQRKFFKNMWNERRHMTDDPLSLLLSLTLNANVAISRYVKDLVENDLDDTSDSKAKIIQSVNISISSKCTYYKMINPNMQVHDMYNSKSRINEIERLSWSKVRLSAHSLAIETGRWNRRGRGRLPYEQRLCQCGQVQTEHHVIEECPISQHIRDLYGFMSLENLMLENDNYPHVCHIVHSILSLYK